MLNDSLEQLLAQRYHDGSEMRKLGVVYGIAEKRQHPDTSGLAWRRSGKVQRKNLKHGVRAHRGDRSRDDCICLLLSVKGLVTPQVSNNSQDGS